MTRGSVLGYWAPLASKGTSSDLKRASPDEQVASDHLELAVTLLRKTPPSVVRARRRFLW
jgi:hypothetical protein